MYQTFNYLIGGAIIMGSWAITLYFIKSLRQTGDSLFAFFAVAFFLFGMERIAFVLCADEMKPYVYVVRLVAFSVIVVGIVIKNRGNRTKV